MTSLLHSDELWQTHNTAQADCLKLWFQTSLSSCDRSTPHLFRPDMFDTKTGEVSCSGVALRRGETREEFLATDAGANAQLMVENEGWSTYRFSPDQKTFFVLQFKNEVIEQVRISLALEGDDPNPWTVESEAERKFVHDKMLRDQLGAPPYRFGWGEIESVNDPRNGASQIILSYT